jgi:hypothetical protein
MRNRPLTVAYGVMLMLGMPAVAQNNGVQQPSARQQLQHIHTSQSINQELAVLTKDLELTPKQGQQVRLLLVEHHDRIQALLDKNPTASRQELGSQIHSISDENDNARLRWLQARERELLDPRSHCSSRSHIETSEEGPDRVRSNPARIGAGARETVNFLIEARRVCSARQPDGVKWLP